MQTTRVITIPHATHNLPLHPRGKLSIGSGGSGTAFNPFGARDTGARNNAPNPFADMTTTTPTEPSPANYLDDDDTGAVDVDLDMAMAMSPGADDAGGSGRKESLGTFLGNSMLQAEARIAALKAKQLADTVEEDEEDDEEEGDEGEASDGEERAVAAGSTGHLRCLARACALRFANMFSIGRPLAGVVSCR